MRDRERDERDVQSALQHGAIAPDLNHTSFNLYAASLLAITMTAAPGLHKFMCLHAAMEHACRYAPEHATVICKRLHAVFSAAVGEQQNSSEARLVMGVLQ